MQRPRTATGPPAVSVSAGAKTSDLVKMFAAGVYCDETGLKLKG